MSFTFHSFFTPVGFLPLYPEELLPPPPPPDRNTISDFYARMEREQLI